MGNFELCVKYHVMKSVGTCQTCGLPPIVLGCYLPGKIWNFLLFVSLVAHTAVYHLKVFNVIKITIKSVPDKLYVQSVLELLRANTPRDIFL